MKLRYLTINLSRHDISEEYKHVPLHDLANVIDAILSDMVNAFDKWDVRGGEATLKDVTFHYHRLQKFVTDKFFNKLDDFEKLVQLIKGARFSS